MNAVKRCLALIAATLVVGACGGDPTADGAGTDLTIRATPGAVWVRNNSSATVKIEAVDKVGSPVEGSWRVQDSAGPVGAQVDTTFQNTTTGPLGLQARFVVTPKFEGDGSVTFSGTGGTIVVPVRVAPDTGLFHVVISDSTPALFQRLTLTAPAGIVFTGGTSVRFYNGPQSRDTSNGGLSFSSVIAISADSTQATFVPGPGASGTMRIGGVASRSTPGLTSTARADFAIAAVPTVDTNAFSVSPAFRLSGNLTMPTVFDTLVLTAPANYRFLASTKVEFFRLGAVTATATNPTGYAVSNGTSNPKILGLSANSDTMRLLVAPGARGRLKINPIAFDTAPAVRFMVRGPEAFDLRRGASGPDTAAFAITFDKASPVAEGDPVTATAPSGMRFMKTTVSIHATSSGAFSGGDSARIVSYSADSTQITFRLPPGASGKARFVMGLKADPEITWFGRSATVISAAAAPAVAATVTPAAGNMNDTITIVLDSTGPYRFRPTSNALAAGLPSAFQGVSTDSLTLKVLPTPNTNAPVTFTNIRYANLPAFNVSANSAGNVQVNAATSLGPDDVNNGFFFNAPDSVGARFAKGFWDATTMTDADPSPGCDGGAKAQFYRMHVSTTGTYAVTVNWNIAAASSDIDIGVMEADGGYSDGGCGDYLSTGGLSGAKPEVNGSLALTAGKDYIIAVIDFNNKSVASDAISINVRRVN